MSKRNKKPALELRKRWRMKSREHTLGTLHSHAERMRFWKVRSKNRKKNKLSRKIRGFQRHGV